MPDKTGRGKKNGLDGRPMAIDYGPLDRHVGYVLRRAQIAVFRDFFQAMGTLDVTPAQYSILILLQRNPGLSPTLVADALGIKKANLVAMIRELERCRLVRREAAAGDRRSVSIFLAPDGEDLTRQLRRAAAAHDRRIRKMLGPVSYAGLFGPLRQLARLADDERRAR